MKIHQSIAGWIGLAAVAVLLALAVVAWLAGPRPLFAPIAVAQEAPVPEDFRLVLRSVPRLPGGAPAEESLILEADGTVALSAQESYSGTLPNIERKILDPAEIELLPEAVREIYAAVREEDFFSLDSVYQDPDILDGDFAVLEITAEGETHRVKTINIAVGAFDRIVRTINRHLPEDRRIEYNALFTEGYEQVER